MHSLALSTDQIVYALKEEAFLELRLPPASTGVGISDLKWGMHDHPKTPAYWAAQSWMWGLEAPGHYKLGNSLEDEIIACLLGGYGIPAEVGIAAYERIRSECDGRYEALADEGFVLDLLSRPLEVRGRKVRCAVSWALACRGANNAAASRFSTIAAPTTKPRSPPCFGVRSNDCAIK